MGSRSTERGRGADGAAPSIRAGADGAAPSIRGSAGGAAPSTWWVAACAIAMMAGAGPARGQTAPPAAPAAAAAAAPGLPAAAASPDQARREADAQQARARLADLEREAATLAARERTLLGTLRALELARATREAEFARAQAELALVQGDLEATTRRVEDLERRLAAERPAINDRIVALYTAGDIAAPWRWPDAATLQDAARAQRLLAAVSAEDRARLQAYLNDVRHLGEARTRLAARLKEAADWQARAAAARDAASRAAAEQADQVGAVAERRDLAERLAGELRQAQRALETTVSGLPAAAPPSVPRAVLPVRAFRGALPWPVPGPLVSRFGRETQSRFGTGLVRNGIEIGAAGQTAVAAVHGGRVAFADQFTGFGRLVILEHGQGVFSLYGHLDALNVARGAQVEAGAVLGRSGRTPGGRDAVYFELRIDGRPVDPLQWLKPR